MPAVSKAQQAMAVKDLERLRAGKKTRTGMSEAELEHFASTPTKSLPKRKKPKKKY